MIPNTCHLVRNGVSLSWRKEGFVCVRHNSRLLNIDFTPPFESLQMAFRKRRFKPPLTDTLGPDDGLEPRFWSRDDEPRRVRNRKALQLCRQIEQALHLALAGCSDPVLQELLIESVRPWPDSARLLVTVQSSGNIDRAQSRLAAAAGLLRREAAAAIHRRKAPELEFRVIPLRS